MPQKSRKHHLVEIRRNRQDPRQARERVRANRNRDINSAVTISLTRSAEVLRPMFLRLPMHSRGFFVEHLHSIYAHVSLSRFGVACNHQGPGDEPPRIFPPAL